MNTSELSLLSNRRIERIHPLISPQEMCSNIPVSTPAAQTVIKGRSEAEAILDSSDNRFLLITGPCSIHDPVSALDYAARLIRLREQYRDIFCIIMRVYFEKPRTSLGWRGLIAEPGLDGLINIGSGLETARRVLSAVTEMGLPAASELLDPVVPQYTADFISWASIGARSAESQIHRELASGLSMPVGFKNPTDGDIGTAINAIVSAREPHAFIGTMQNGYSAVMHTTGNEYAHLVLRGGKQGANYGRQTVMESCRLLTERNIQPAVLIDCSHGNSQKDPGKQKEVLLETIRLRLGPQPLPAIRGCMLESFIQAGSAALEHCRCTAEYGKSVTDPCMSWEMTEAAVSEAADLWRTLT
ncbi:MAG: 3-deoxy-7-phosphoheptulonate synthase [Treponema sp.]